MSIRASGRRANSGMAPDAPAATTHTTRPKHQKSHELGIPKPELIIIQHTGASFQNHPELLSTKHRNDIELPQTNYELGVEQLRNYYKPQGKAR